MGRCGRLRNQLHDDKGMTKGQENAAEAMNYDEKWRALSFLPNYISAHCNTRH